VAGMIRRTIQWIKSLLPTREIWKAVVGCEGYYEVSDYGRVRSLRFRRGLADRPRNEPMIAQVAASGHSGPHVRLNLPAAASRTVTVARLVAEAFVGPAQPGFVVAPRDGNLSNTCAENLEWVPRAELQRRIAQGPKYLASKPQGERHGQAKLTAMDIVEIRRLAAAGLQRAHIAERYGIRRSTVGNIVRRESWKHID